MHNFKRIRKMQTAAGGALNYGGYLTSSQIPSPSSMQGMLSGPLNSGNFLMNPGFLLLTNYSDLYNKLINLSNFGSNQAITKADSTQKPLKSPITSKGFKLDKNSASLLAGLASDAISGMMGPKDGYNGPEGDLLLMGDQMYDAAADTMMSINPMIGGIMKAGGMVSDVLTLYGGMGTDSMTKADALLGSKLLSLTPLGMINGWGGSKTLDFSMNADTIEKVGSSYGGSVSDIYDAVGKSGKKYGLLSSRAKGKANDFISNTRARQNKMTDIANQASDMRANASNMSNSQAYNFNMQGGYDQRYMRAAKHGGNLIRIKKIDFHKQGGNIKGIINFEEEFIPEIVDLPEMFKDGGKIEEFIPEIVEVFKDGGPAKKPTFDEWFSSIPEKYKGKLYDYKLAYNVLPTDQLLNHAKNPEKYHLQSVSGLIDELGRIPFLKLGKVEENPEILPEFDAYNNDSTLSDFRNKYEILYINDRYYYVPRKFKEGGKVETEESSQKNLIPEGALHARKHHMENDENITKKGIPVIDNDGEQQAEIEHSELIFTLEVTKKLEELQLKYYETKDDLYAIEAGKLLVQEILYNTDDRMDLIKSCKEGGVL